MDTDGKKKVIGAAVVVAVVILVVVLMVAVVTKKQTDVGCELVSKEPSSAAKSVNNICSNSTNALANFDGYFQYAEGQTPAGNSTYLPLTLRTVGDYNPTSKTFSLINDCAKLEMSLVLEPYTKYAIEVELRKSGAENDFAYLCRVVAYDKSFAAGAHYACERSVRYECNQDVVLLIGWLVVNRIEFEVGQPSEEHKAGKFVRPASTCNPI